MFTCPYWPPSMKTFLFRLSFLNHYVDLSSLYCRFNIKQINILDAFITMNVQSAPAMPS